MAELSDPNRPTQKISSKGQSYTVQRGDTLESVAKRFNLTPKFLARMNRMRGDTSPTTGLDIGSVMTIPRVEFDPFGPIGAAWAEGHGWTQSGWSESPWYETGPVWVENGKFVEVGGDPFQLPNLPGGGGIKQP